MLIISVGIIGSLTYLPRRSVAAVDLRESGHQALLGPLVFHAAGLALVRHDDDVFTAAAGFFPPLV